MIGDEPNIMINGIVLSTAEAMTVRVALGSFAISLSDGLGEDETGQAICKGYKRCIASVHRIIHEGEHK